MNWDKPCATDDGGALIKQTLNDRPTLIYIGDDGRKRILPEGLVSPRNTPEAAKKFWEALIKFNEPLIAEALAKGVQMGESNIKARVCDSLRPIMGPQRMPGT